MAIDYSKIASERKQFKTQQANRRMRSTRPGVNKATSRNAPLKKRALSQTKRTVGKTVAKRTAGTVARTAGRIGLRAGAGVIGGAALLGANLIKRAERKAIGSIRSQHSPERMKRHRELIAAIRRQRGRS